MTMYSERAAQLVAEVERELEGDFRAIDALVLDGQARVLDAFKKNRIALRHFAPTTGYGYDDAGRDTLSRVYADAFGCEDALVSTHILSGTHAIAVALFGILRPGDTLLSISGAPYDTLAEVIDGGGKGGLKDFGIAYECVDVLPDGSFDILCIAQYLKKKPKMVFIQRSRGYTARGTFSIGQIEAVCAEVRRVHPDAVIFVDNCYGEFTDIREPVAAGADIMAGSLIKNPGGGLAQNGGYIAGRSDLVALCACRLTTASVGGEIGANFGGYQYLYQGFFMAPHTTGQALKGALLLSAAMKALGYKIVPERRACYDLIASVQFDDPHKLIAFCRMIQQVSPIDSFVTPEPWAMPGYADEVIMAAGCFVQGSSIELSCDAPLRPPYIAYFQGGLTYEHVKLAALACIDGLSK